MNYTNKAYALTQAYASKRIILNNKYQYKIDLNYTIITARISKHAS
jgi:hypothetical protein